MEGLEELEEGKDYVLSYSQKYALDAGRSVLDNQSVIVRVSMQDTPVIQAALQVRIFVRRQLSDVTPF